MMTRSSFSRPLRRFLATLGMVTAGHAGACRALQARPALPPAGVDRVQVGRLDGSHTITDRPTIDGILAIVRAHRGEWTRFPDTVCLLDRPGAGFYEGAALRATITWGPGSIVMTDRHATSTRMLSARDAAELARLLER